MRGKSAEKGTVLVFVALMLPFLVFFAGMGIDVGRAYLYKSHMQNAADAAALAGVEKAGGLKGRLVRSGEVPLNSNIIQSESSAVADEGANKILAMDKNNIWNTQKSNTHTEMRKIVRTDLKNPIMKNQAATYYYKVVLTDNMPFDFAKNFLPADLLPDNWKIYVEAWAMSNVREGGIDLDTQLRAARDAYTASTFQELEAGLKKPSNFNSKRDYAKAISFTNKGPAYNADGTRTEIHDMDGTASLNNNMKSLFVNFKPDFITSQKMTGNWDLHKIANMTVQEAREYIYALGMQITNWRIVDASGTALEENEGGISLWGRFYEKLVKYFGENVAKQLMYTPITSVINVTNPYPVRELEQLSEDEISYDIRTDEPNKLDPLFIRIESEEYNTGSGSTSWVTNTARDININILADNTPKSTIAGKYYYRPMLFFYDGPVGDNDERGTGRKSRTVTLNLDKDFRGVLYAPNSPVCVQGNGHKFQGIIVAERIVDAAGNTIEMPGELNSTTNPDFQLFYTKLGLSEAYYDDFGAIALTVYNDPKQDIVYLTERAKVTI